VTATDNCDGAVSVTCTPGNITGPLCSRSQAFVYSAVDQCGNPVSATVTYTWKQDLIPPVLSNLPNGGYIGCNPTLPVCATNVTATDNCDGAVSVTCTPGNITGPLCSRSQAFVYSAIDQCGNPVSATVTYNWKQDLTPPVLANLPNGGYLGCNPTLPVCSTTVTATDNCDGAVSVTCTPGNITGPLCNRSQSFVYSAVDQCGNPVSATVTWTWKQDLTPPVLANLPTGGYLGCNPTLPVCATNVTATDNCDGPLSITCTPGNITGTSCDKTQVFVYSAIDLCSNAVSASVTYTWKSDLIPPALTCPGDFSAVCTLPDPPLDWETFQDAGGSASDNCGLVEASFEYIGEDTIDYDPVTVSRYYRIEDICGNADTCTQIITVVELEIHAWVYLEGSAISLSGAQTFTVPMRHTLNDLKVLPGQTYYREYDNKIIYNQPGQPYDTIPWNYFGTEGDGYDSDSIPNPGTANYPSTAVDWVLVSLRATLNSDPVCQTAAILLDDGTIDFVEGGFSCCDINLTTSYYLIIEHRNHLIIASPTPLPIANGAITFDFRFNQSYIPSPNIFGYVGQKPILPGKYAMYGGNGDQGLLQGGSATDINLDDWGYWYGWNGRVGEYRNADYNMNVDVNYNDRPVWEYNNGLFTSVPRP
jgi:hypothetical protein